MNAPNALPAILTAKPTVTGMWAAFRRRWRIATGLGLVVAVAAAVAAWYLTSAASYTVATTLHVDSVQSHMFGKTGDNQVDFITYKQAQTRKVKSRMVFNAALRDPKASQLAIVKEQPDPLEWLTKEVQIDFLLSSETMRLQMIGKDSEALVILLDAIREAYLSEVVNKEEAGRLIYLEKLNKKSNDLADELGKQRKTFHDLAEGGGNGNAKAVAQRQELAQAELIKMRGVLVDYQSTLRQLKAEVAINVDQEQALQDTKIPDAIIEDAISNDPVVIGYEREIADLEAFLAEFRTTSAKPESAPAYQDKERALEKVRTKKEKRQADLRPKIESELRAKRRYDLARVRSDKAQQIAMIEKMEDWAKNGVEELTNQTQGFTPKKGVGLDEQKDQLDINEQIYKKLAADAAVMKLELPEAKPRVTTEEPAYATRRDGIGIKAAIGAALGAFGLVVFGISFLEFRARRLVAPEEVSQGLRLPVIGMMPRMPSRHTHAKPQADGSRGAAAQRLMIESVDAARAVILHASKQRSLRVVMITSAVGGEGKTMLSAHLAASLARAGWRALLVDADFRRPSLQTVFGLPEEAGLSEVLRGEANIREVMQPGPMDGLWVVSAGSCDTCSMQGLAQGGLRRVFEEIKGEFDLIVVDSAPVLPVVDSQIIAQAVDGVILSVLRDVSRLPLIHAAYERLTFFQVSLLGAVVHGANAGTYGFQYPYTTIPAAKATVPTTPE
jgi:capsular exopolysaccharide synthesis family protein